MYKISRFILIVYISHIYYYFLIRREDCILVGRPAKSEAAAIEIHCRRRERRGKPRAAAVCGII
jgi:hypothetical protein